jgi:hypothetical protein
VRRLDAALLFEGSTPGPRTGSPPSSRRRESGVEPPHSKAFGVSSPRFPAKHVRSNRENAAVRHALVCACFVLGVSPAWCAAAQAEPRAATATVSFGDRLGPLRIDRMALGQGGLSDEPMWDDRIVEIRSLHPAVIRLFIQEYFDLLPEKGRYHFDTLDRSVDTILKTGAKPLMCICFKPKVLFPAINQDVVEPNDYDEWERLIFAMVKRYRDKGAGIQYWEVSNEPDIGESGGCPYRFKPDSYVCYYKHTVAAILRADPQARVGGPALAGCRSPILPALLDSASSERTPLHFVSWHIYSSDPKAVGGTVEYVKGRLEKHPSLQVETVLDEWNMDLTNPPLDPQFQPCFIAETIWRMKDAGLDLSCYYHIRDWHVNFDRFAAFMSPGGNVFMARWWNRMPQFDGLFDYQNTMRPSYFAFALLSRLQGERCRLESSDPAVHGFLTYDPKLEMYNLLIWNFANAPARIEIALDGLTKNMRARQLTLDARAPGSDENIRLRPTPYFTVKKDERALKDDFEPYGIKYWSFE